MRIELHCHSRYSRRRNIPVEGLDTPADIVRTAKSLGLDGIALTDHSTDRGWKEAAQEARKLGMVFIPAIEISSLDGHIIGLGLNEYVKSGLPLEETLDRIRGQGGVSVAAHPFDIRREGAGKCSSKADAIETFNSMNLDRFSNHAAASFAHRQGKPCVAGSDSHTKEMIGSSINHIDAYDVDSVLKQIKSGRISFWSSYITLGKLIPWVKARMALSHGDVLDYIEENYSQPKRWISERMLCKFVSSGNDRKWYWLGEAGLAGSRLYGMARAFSTP